MYAIIAACKAIVHSRKYFYFCHFIHRCIISNFFSTKLNSWLKYLTHIKSVEMEIFPFQATRWRCVSWEATTHARVERVLAATVVHMCRCLLFEKLVFSFILTSSQKVTEMEPFHPRLWLQVPALRDIWWRISIRNSSLLCRLNM